MTVAIAEDFQTSVQAEPKSDGYIVVMKNLTGVSAGVCTWTTYESKEAFVEWYKSRMMDGTNRPLTEVYEITAEGVSQKEALAMISSGPNTMATLVSLARSL